MTATTAIDEPFGVQDIYADGWKITRVGPVVEVMFYVRRHAGNAEGVMRVHVPIDGYFVSCNESTATVRGGSTH